MKSLSSQKRVKPRFARSINIERDSGTNAVDGYLPVGRALEAISRLAGALDRSDVEVAISITGPYGSGKSSLALIIDALLGPVKDPARVSASSMLLSAAPAVHSKIESARMRFGASRSGFIRATATAQREPITATVLRALLNGVTRFKPTAAKKSELDAVRRVILRMIDAESGEQRLRPDARAIREVITALGSVAPVLLLIDEFGKNLEAFADSRSDADLYLLQELAEWTRGGDGIPLALVTLQHMAFDEYANSASSAQRREWAKIQGRFEDVPFVDSPAQTRSLIASAFEKPSPALQTAQKSWAAIESLALRRIGLTDLANDSAQIAGCWPIHPVALAALPELCERYGQNERTLFSFLAGHEPLSVATFLDETEWAKGDPLPVVRMDRLYDYFIEAASNLVSVSANASRWLEVDVRIRDASGLKPPARRVLKTVGLLNLVSAGGTLRASKEMVCYAAADGITGTKDLKQVAKLLIELDAAGLITYREFADEYRVWQGSDFDLRSAVEAARRRLKDEPASGVLNRVMPLSPLVAARHSHKTGTLRAFERVWISAAESSIDPLGASDRPDGLALYVLGENAPTKAVRSRKDAKPVVFATTAKADPVIHAALELAAVEDVLSSSEEIADDWVAKRELVERRYEAFAALDRAVHSAFGEGETKWRLRKPGSAANWTISKHSMGGSSVVSDACDAWYRLAPVIRNDLIMRHDLSTQAAKARRLVLEGLAAHASEERLGIEGFGPDATLYRSVLEAHGLHKQDKAGDWILTGPSIDSSLLPYWEKVISALEDSVDRRTRLDEIYRESAAPPYGVREGFAPVVVVAAVIVRFEEIALYEHGTFRPNLTPDLLERLLKNPGNFEVKFYATRGGARSELLTQLADQLGINAARTGPQRRVGSVLAIVSYLVALLNGLPEHIRKTKELSEDAKAVRRALQIATEPDDLLFTEIPKAFQLKPIMPSTSPKSPDIRETAMRLTEVCNALKGAYPALLNDIREAVAKQIGPGCDPLRESLSTRARELSGKIIDPQVLRLVVALTADIPDEDAWLAYVAMNLSGAPPEGWTDEDRKRFFVTVAEVGGVFRRIYALNADLSARGDGFDAYRHVVTRTDGTEVVQLLAVNDEQRLAGRPILDEAVSHLGAALGGSAADARALLLGLLGEDDFNAVDAASQVNVLAPAYDGQVGNQRDKGRG